VVHLYSISSSLLSADFDDLDLDLELLDSTKLGKVRSNSPPEPSGAEIFISAPAGALLFIIFICIYLSGMRDEALILANATIGPFVPNIYVPLTLLIFGSL